MSATQPTNPYDAPDFAHQAEHASPGLARELWDLLRYNKKWWLLPILFVLLIAALAIMVGGTVFAPFIYPLF